jgi:BirA family biotin operon repressor/biotin-[acetyl-CoA-carboxylase] ligase
MSPAVTPLPWPVEALWRDLSAQEPGLTVEAVAEIDSSNEALMRRARQGQADPVLLVTAYQSAGRGRRGRPWQAAPGDALMFSLGLMLAPVRWEGLSLAVGLALVEALDPTGAHQLALKWPNDLWRRTPEGWRKLAGILIETANVPGRPEVEGRYVVIGVGLNVRAPVHTDLSMPAAGVRDWATQAEAGPLLLQLAPPLLRAVQAFARTGFAPLRARYHARDALQGEVLRLSDGREGLGEGVDADGALCVRGAEGSLWRVSSEEVSVRPHPTPHGGSP